MNALAVVSRADLLGASPSPAWSAELGDLLQGADAAPAKGVLCAVLSRVTRVAPAAARTALAVAGGPLLGRADPPALRGASASLRAAYEAAAPARSGHVRAEREAHGDRFSVPWIDPCDDPAELRPLAACVAAVYAVEAWSEGEPVSRMCCYVRAAWGWSWGDAASGWAPAWPGERRGPCVLPAAAPALERRRDVVAAAVSVLGWDLHHLDLDAERGRVAVDVRRGDRRVVLRIDERGAKVERWWRGTRPEKHLKGGLTWDVPDERFLGRLSFEAPGDGVSGFLDFLAANGNGRELPAGVLERQLLGGARP